MPIRKSLCPISDLQLKLDLWINGTVTVSSSAFSWKKIQKLCLRHTVTVTFCSEKIQKYMKIESQLDNIEMFILNGICQYDRKDATLNQNKCQFSGPSTSAIFEENPKHRNIHKLIQCEVTWIFPKTSSVMVLRFEFISHNLPIRVKLTLKWACSPPGFSVFSFLRFLK